MSRPRVAIVVVAYDGGSDLHACLSALSAGDCCGAELLVVDNASRDGSTETLEAGALALDLLSLRENRGFAGAVNAGLRRLLASARPPDIVVLLNQDCMVHEGWLDPLVAALQRDPQLAVVGARLLEPDGATLQHAGGVIHANGLTDHIGRGVPAEGAFTEDREVDYVTGALCAFSAETWLRFGPFDEGYYPVYFEEVDFCLRARRAGKRVLYVAASVASHREAASSGRGSRLFLRRYHRNRIRFSLRHLLVRGSRAAWLRAELAWLLAQREAGSLAPALKAYAEAPSLWRQLQRQRRAIAAQCAPIAGGGGRR